MSQEGHETVKNESDLYSEDISTLSHCTGKRCREETFATPDESVKATDLDLCRETAPVGGYQNGGEEKAPSGDNLQLGKRIKADCDAQHETAAENTPKKVEQISDDHVGATVSEKAPEHACEIVAKENDAQFHCNVCSVKCTSEKDYSTHISGKRHARALMGIVKTRSGKVRKLVAGSKGKISIPQETAVLHEDVSNEQQVPVDGFITADGHLSSCPGGTELQGGDLHTLGSSAMDGGKDVIMEQQDPREGATMEALGAEILKHETTSKIAVHDGNGNFQETLTIGSMHKMSADQLAYGSIMDSGCCKSNSDCVARALAIAFQACACPGLEGLSKSGAHMVSRDSVTAGAVDSKTPEMVSMHAHCFMNLLRDVQVKAMEDLFRCVTHEERARGFTLESLLPTSAPSSAIPPSEKDWNCSVCHTDYGRKSDPDRHVTGRKHTSMVRRVHLRCHLCEVDSNSEKDLETHMNGKKHASKLRLVHKGVDFETN